MRQTIHQEASTFPGYPIKALAQQLHSILQQGNNNTSLLSEVHRDEIIYHVTPADMIVLLCQAVHTLKLNELGINPDLIRAHSLQKGGAMALKLNGTSNT
eukprot:3023164-Ditylum_brightwellii.AAC.1